MKRRGLIVKRAKKAREGSFYSFLTDPVVSLAILVFAFIALLLSLQQFIAGRGF